MKEDYGDYYAFKRRENKAKTNPILVSPQIFWGLKNQFEKTNPICSNQNWCNIFCKRRLWKYVGLWSRRKQSQFQNVGLDAVWIPAFAGMTNMESLHGGIL
jgi:hypothetical protein